MFEYLKTVFGTKPALSTDGVIKLYVFSAKDTEK